MRIDVLNGANTDQYGRDPSGAYGPLTLADIEAQCRARAASGEADIVFRQSNHEGDLVGWLHEARTGADGLVINAGSLSYTSISIRDALAAFGKPAIQVHVSNVFTREPFRHISPLSAVVSGCIIGMGPAGYALAVTALIDQLRRT
ncbi:type II 3-dehydroquinate dehydratase [Ancylobacter terrae]|uniref:type II 3-dehydroquinate dehydratase n=1 Tax=Ancylobacter sp. sgz301288 TaxID=3342077 RepID=UPI00385B6B0D